MALNGTRRWAKPARMIRLAGLLALLLLGLPPAASAASSGWHETTGGAVRLVTTGLPDAEGRLRGALEIRLTPGWKTYWRDPGASGVAPELDIGSAGSVEMQYPAPQWHHDGQFDWAGYKHSVSLPVILSLRRSGPIEATAFIGLCETICVPLQAKLSLDPASGADDAMDAASVEKAFAALPGSATEKLGVDLRAASGRELALDARLDRPEGAALFVAGGDGYQFGKPKLRMEAGRPVFAVKVLARPKAKPSGAGLPYTLVTPAGAVSGLLPYF